MENCIYNGKEICAYELKDKDGLYLHTRVEELKLAAARRELSCCDCGEKVYLAAGPIMEPYFAHYDKKNCEYGNFYESEESKKGKRLLYHLMSKRGGQTKEMSQVFIRYRMKNGQYSSCYETQSGGRDIAIDYRLQNNTIQEFFQREEYLKKIGAKVLYVLGIRRYHGKQMDWYQNLIQKSMGYLLFLDTENESLLFVKSFDYKIGGERRIHMLEKVYSMEKLSLDHQGQPVCDFAEECAKVEQAIYEETKSYEMRIQEERERKRQMEQARSSWTLHYKEKYLSDKERSMPNTERNSVAAEGNNLPEDIRSDILEHARKMVERGEEYLVSKKYLDYIRNGKV